MLCTCTMPFCGEDHAPLPLYVPTDAEMEAAALLDWEGPMQPEYSEYDAESYDEMVSQSLY